MILSSETVIERYVMVLGFTHEDQVESLRRATGMLPGDMGRWKGNDEVTICEPHDVDAAIDWAREHRRAYEVCVTVRYEPAEDTSSDEAGRPGDALVPAGESCRGR